MTRTIIGLTSLLILTGCSSVPKLTEVWRTEPVLMTCEAALYHPADNLLYVSCIDGPGGEKNGTGFIAKVELDGSIHTLKWAEGMNAPKGMAIVDNRLYVSDIDELREIDLSNGEITQTYPAAGAEFLNDVAATPDGAVIVGDSSADSGKLYRLMDGKLEAWINRPLVHRPNGLFVQGNTLFAGDARDGKLKAIDLKTEAVSDIVQTDTGIDGLKPYGKGGWLTSNWKGRTTLITSAGETIILLDTTEAKINSADFEYLPKQKLLIIPTFFDNRLVAYRTESRMNKSKSQ